MNIQAIKIELIEMLLQEQNQASLLAIKKILQSNVESGSDVIDIKKRLVESEKQYKNGETIDYESVLNESEKKYFSE